MPKIVSVAEHCRRNGLESLLAEYMPDNPFSAEQIGYTSHKEVNWQCKHGHIETESPYKRFRRGYCKTCGREQNGSFAQAHPDMAKFWSKENECSADNVSPRYSKPVIWECEKGHKWERSIATQLAAVSPCPFCKSEENALFAIHPEWLKEWDLAGNEYIDPFSVSRMSNTRYRWICPNGHSYEASPAERIRRHKSCPICRSFASRCPDAAAEWHPFKNDFSPYDVSPSSTKTAWFICRCCKQEYLSVIQDRARRKGPNCPHCRGN